MEEEFFATLKLTTGEELISKVSYMADQDTLILDRPMVVEKIIQKRGNRAIEGFHLREWMTATYENLFIRDGSEKPTKQECIDGVNAMQADYDARQYQRDRMVSYPSLQEQLDLIYWDKINDTEKWKETIDKVKTDNPKPE